MYSKQAARKLPPRLVGGECLPASLPTCTPTPTRHHPISSLSAFVLKLHVREMCSLQQVERIVASERYPQVYSQNL